jgi:hypothetical protein
MMELRADVNGDTVPNELDIAPFVTCLINGECP